MDDRLFKKPCQPANPTPLCNPGFPLEEEIRDEPQPFEEPGIASSDEADEQQAADPVDKPVEAPAAGALDQADEEPTAEPEDQLVVAPTTDPWDPPTAGAWDPPAAGDWDRPVQAPTADPLENTGISQSVSSRSQIVRSSSGASDYGKDNISSIELALIQRTLVSELRSFFFQFAVDAVDFFFKLLVALLVFFDSDTYGTEFLISFSVVITLAVIFTILSNVRRASSLADLRFVAKHGYSKKWAVQVSTFKKGGMDPRIQRDQDFRRRTTRGWKTAQVFFVDGPWFLASLVRLTLFVDTGNSLSQKLVSLCSMGLAGYGIGVKTSIVIEFVRLVLADRKKNKTLFEIVPAEIKIAAHSSGELNTAEAMKECIDAVVQQIGTPTFCIITMTSNHNHSEGLDLFVKECTGVKFSGCTTCSGTLCGGKSCRESLTQVGIWAISDPEGFYQPGIFDTGDDAFQAASKSMKAAYWKAKKDHATKRDSRRLSCRGKDEASYTPPLGKASFVWINPCPGTEDQVILGMNELLTNSVPIIGGSSADNTVAGEWKQWASTDGQDYVIMSGGCSYTLAYSSACTSCCLFTGYSPSAHQGTITKTNGPRHILEIDGKPAMEVYNRWTGGCLQEFMLENDSNILAASSLYPIGQRQGLDDDGMPYFRVCHPHLVKTDTKSFTLFADVAVGENVTMMSGTKDNLVHRVAQVASRCIASAQFTQAECRGALIIYCAGCMMYCGDLMTTAARSLDSALGGIPHLGMHTFGETGPFPDGTSRHGNLMFSALVISSKRRVTKVLDMDSGETFVQDGPAWDKLMKSGALDEVLQLNKD